MECKRHLLSFLSQALSSGPEAEPGGLVSGCPARGLHPPACAQPPPLSAVLGGLRASIYCVFRRLWPGGSVLLPGAVTVARPCVTSVPLPGGLSAKRGVGGSGGRGAAGAAASTHVGEPRSMVGRGCPVSARPALQASGGTRVPRAVLPGPRPCPGGFWREPRVAWISGPPPGAVHSALPTVTRERQSVGQVPPPSSMNLCPRGPSLPDGVQ